MSAKYDGRVILTQLADGEVRVERADQRVRVAGALLRAIQREGSPHASFDGHLLRITAANRSLIYRADDYDDATDTMLMAWPD